MKKQTGRLLAAAAILAISVLAAACQPSAPSPAPTATSVPPTATIAATPAELETFSVDVSPTETSYVLEGAITTESGLQYLEVVAGDGEAPQAGDIISMHYIASLPDGTELANTYTQNQTVSAVWGLGNLLPGWEEGLGLMKVNGKARLVLPSELAFGEEGTSAVPPHSQLVLEIELLSAEPAPMPTDVKEADLTTSETGLMYYDLKEGDGAEAVANGSVSTLYTMWVKTEDGYEYIASSDNGTPVTFQIGSSDVVFPGWVEGATGMKVGGKRLVIVPPDLGLGDQALGAIPANATLVLEIELTEASEPRLPAEVDESDYTTTESGLKYYDLVVGDGESPAEGQVVMVHYTGWLEDGTQFDSSIDSGQPFSFTIGAGQVIPGWDEGVATMKVGGKRQLVIPAELGDGESGAGELIPPGATLIFEVELLEIQ